MSGVCYVGIWNVDSLRGFIVAPLVFYLLVGTAFLASSFVSLFRIKTIMKHEGASTAKLEQLMTRIGVFSTLYIVPASCVVACLLYEQALFDTWMVTWQRDKCRLREYAIPCPPETAVSGDGSRPNFSVLMLKYFMALFVGITSGFWTWSSKTLNSWRRFYSKIISYLSFSRSPPDGAQSRSNKYVRGGRDDESLHLDLKYGPRNNRHEGYI